MRLCDVCTRNQTSTGLMCESCSVGVHNDLDEIGRRYRALSAMPGASGDNAGRRAPGFESRPPCNLNAIDLDDVRDSTSVPAILGRWCAQVVDERGVQAPSDVIEGVAFLQRHLAWIAERPWLLGLVRDVRRLKGRLRPATGQPAGIVIGRCPNTIDEGEYGRPCGAKLTAPIYGDAVECPSCERVWGRREWFRLGTLLQSGVAS